MKRWTLKDIKSKGIFIDEKGVGRVLTPTKRVVTEKDIEKALKKANGKKKQVRSSTEGTENL